jgi:hypothetical protein
MSNRPELWRTWRRDRQITKDLNMPVKPGFALFLGMAISLTGCVTAPAPKGQAYSARYIGDRSSLSLGEQVFTIRVVDGQSSEQRNLHVQLEVLINPKTVSLSSEYEVDGIIRRLDPRIKARLADYLPMGKSIPINTLVGVKDEMVQEAQKALMASYSKWKKADDYEVQVVATGFHLTDLSSGTPAVATRSWW